MKKEFDKWNRVKKEIDARQVKKLYFKEREIWFCSIGINVGSEQNGHNQNFERPILIVKKINHHTFLGVPISSKLSKGKYDYTCKSEAGACNLKLSQVRLWDTKRLLRKANMLPGQDFNDVKKALRKLFE